MNMNKKWRDDTAAYIMDLILPEADIDGLRFNETKVHAEFELKEDGWYHSRDILFLSARNADDNNSKDILTEYIIRNSDAKGNIKDTLIGQIAAHFKVAPYRVEISLPKENEDVKQYNGGDCWYWLKYCYSGAADCFCYVNRVGHAGYSDASSVGGCAPMFRIKLDKVK
jgi:hypothetical protein